MRAMREQWPFLPEVRLYHSKGKARRHMRDWEGVEFIDSAGAQTWYADGEAIVLMNYRGSRAKEDSLLVHEAVHVVRMHFSETLMEEHAGEEMYAYATQSVAHALMRANRKWCRKHISGH